MPIISLTAETQVADIELGFNSGGDDYLKKPFSMKELIVRIENLRTLQREQSQIQKQEPYQISSFEFGPALLELKSPSNSFRQSNRENELLKNAGTASPSIKGSQQNITRNLGRQSFSRGW